METVKCDNCGKKVQKYPSEIEKSEHNFCSQDCFNEWRKKQRVEVECDNCGKKFKVTQWRAKKDHHFCSRECTHEWLDKYNMKHDIPEDKLRRMYHDKGMTQSEIAEEFGCTQWTVWSRMKRYGIDIREDPLAKRIDLDNTEELSYILGVVEGDGWVTKNEDGGQYVVGLDVRDKPFAEKFASSLEEIGIHSKVRVDLRDKRTPDGKLYEDVEFFRINSYSKKFYEWYTDLDRSEFESVVREHPWNFIEGFFESDGSYINSGSITFGNTDEYLIDLVKSLLQQGGMHPLKSEGNVFRLVVKKSESDMFFDHIYPCLERKRPSK